MPLASFVLRHVCYFQGVPSTGTVHLQEYTVSVKKSWKRGLHKRWHSMCLHRQSKLAFGVCLIHMAIAKSEAANILQRCCIFFSCQDIAKGHFFNSNVFSYEWSRTSSCVYWLYLFPCGVYYGLSSLMNYILVSFFFFWYKREIHRDRRGREKERERERELLWLKPRVSHIIHRLYDGVISPIQLLSFLTASQCPTQLATSYFVFFLGFNRFLALFS